MPTFDRATYVTKRLQVSESAIIVLSARAHTLRSARLWYSHSLFSHTRMTNSHGGAFTGTLFRYPGKGGWHFVVVPDSLSPPVTHGWGRTPVDATVDGVTWQTSVWRGKDGRTLLAVPVKVRGRKGDGDSVRVRLRFSL